MVFKSRGQRVRQKVVFRVFRMEASVLIFYALASVVEISFEALYKGSQTIF